LTQTASFDDYGQYYDENLYAEGNPSFDFGEAGSESINLGDSEHQGASIGETTHHSDLGPSSSVPNKRIYSSGERKERCALGKKLKDDMKALHNVFIVKGWNWWTNKYHGSKITMDESKFVLIF
jgi:hypothetical protein